MNPFSSPGRLAASCGVPASAISVVRVLRMRLCARSADAFPVGSALPR